MNLSYFVTPALGLDALNLYTNLYHTFVILDLKDAIHPRVKSRARQELADFDFAQLNDQLQLGVRIKSCRFCEVKGHQQYVELKFAATKSGQPSPLKPMKFRADHAVSFCLQAR